MDWLKLGSILGYVTPILIISYKLWFEHHFKKKLLKFNSDIDLAKDKQLKNFSKTITGFNKFIDKKYEVYPMILAELQKTQGEIYSNWENNTFSNLQKVYNTEHFSGLLDSFYFSIPDKNSLIEKHKLGKLTDMDFNELLPTHIRRSIINSNNSYQVHRLFFSVKIDKLVNEILTHFEEARSGYFGVYNKFKKRIDTGDKIKPAYEKSGSMILQLINLMRKELEHNLASKEL